MNVFLHSAHGDALSSLIFFFNFRWMFLFFLGDRAKEKRLRERDIDLCGLCMIAGYIAVFSHAFPFFVGVHIDKRIVPFICQEKKSNGSSLI